MKEETLIQITIDGPAGAGKSTVARAVARKLNYVYIDTGAMYRAVAWLAVQQGLSVEDQASLTVLAEKADIQFKVSHRGQQKIFCNHIDVTHVIRSPQISRLVSEIAAVPGVRQALVKMQQSLAADQNVVMDGRDAGTVILPQAQCKIYLTASVEERARRRLAQMQRLGLTQPMDEVIRDIKQRDYQDVHRSTSPLKPAEDAILLDCTDLDLDETISEVLKIIQNSKQDD
ncbi:MAG TPA: (d)CMP kinase [Peptococcaceae bacterium]|nr:(d)CMP kinase [Peptococcaceae bacterium]